jgi:hypothetical protein
MSPAKVTSGKKSFYVQEGNSINNYREFDGLPTETRRYISLYFRLIGTTCGFILDPDDGGDTIRVARSNRIPEGNLPGVSASWRREKGVLQLVLPEDVVVEPIRSKQMETEINSRKSSQKER